MMAWTQTIKYKQRRKAQLAGIVRASGAHDGRDDTDRAPFWHGMTNHHDLQTGAPMTNQWTTPNEQWRMTSRAPIGHWTFDLGAGYPRSGWGHSGLVIGHSSSFKGTAAPDRAFMVICTGKSAWKPPLET
jgi:hypothetical protein